MISGARPRALDLTAESVRREITETLPTGLIVLNTMGYVVEINALAREMLQRPASAEASSGKAAEHIDTLLPQWLGHAGTASETIAISAGEHTRYVRVRSALLGKGSDAPLGTLITLEDVTERTRLENEIAARTRELEVANARLEALSNTDPLTGAWNRRYFEDRGCRELERADRNNSTLGLLMLDIDRFKPINDDYGHAVGDAILKTLVTRLSSELRTTDMLARVGGEEFAVLLSDCDDCYMLEVAERLHAVVAETPFTTPTDVSLPVTISIGITVSHPSGHHTGSCEERLRALMHTADRYLYQAKEAGRNQFVGPSPP